MAKWLTHDFQFGFVMGAGAVAVLVLLAIIGIALEFYRGKWR